MISNIGIGGTFRTTGSSITFTSDGFSILTGTTIVIVVSDGAALASMAAPTDDANNTYVLLGTGVSAAGNDNLKMWGVLSSASSVSTITITGGIGRKSAALNTYTGVFSFNQSNTNTATGNSSLASITLGSMGANSWAIAGFTDLGTATWSASIGNLRRSISGATSSQPGSALVDNTAIACASVISASGPWGAVIIEMTDGGIPPLVYSVPDCRSYGNFPNLSRNVNGTLTYDTPSMDSRAAGAPMDSRTSGAPSASGTYPQNSRTPGTFGPGE